MHSSSNQSNDKKLSSRFLILSLISFLPFLILSLSSFYYSTEITHWDYQIGSFFYDLRSPLLTELEVLITRLANVSGQVVITLIITLVLLVLKKWRTGIWYGLTVLLGAGALNGLVKNIFQRVRPDQISHLIEQGGYAFPSGHAMGSMIIFGGLLFLVIRSIHTKNGNTSGWKWLLTLILGLLILSIGLSRIYLGVHYPSDVIGGFSLGLAWLSLSIAGFGLSLTRQEF